MKAQARFVALLSRSASGRNQSRHNTAAPRASSLSADGSGARSRRARLSALALAIAALALLAFASLAGAKEVTKFFGTLAGTSFGSGAGSFGGEFNNPRDIAVNSRGVGVPVGTIYVADDTNHRIQRFDRNHRFVSAWGKDTIAATINERQRLVIEAEGGSYFLTFDGVTSAPIAFDADSGAVQAALRALSSIGSPNVTVSGAGSGLDPFVITFTGPLAARDLLQITADTSQLQGTARIATLADGDASVANDTGTAFEICTVATECKAGTASGGDGTAAGNGTLSAPQSVAVDNDTGNVYVSDRDNRRINAYDASGNFISSYGWNVVNSGSNNAAEFQSVTVDATSGTFTLSFGATPPTATDPLDFNASAATIQSRLEALGGIGAGNVLVSGPDGGPWTVRFVGALSNTNVALLGADATLLIGDNPAIAGTGPTATATEVLAGAQAANYEICPASNVCQAGSGGTGAGRYAAGTQAGGYGIAVSQPDGNASTGTIYLANTSSTAAQRRVNTYRLDGTVFSSIGSSANFASQYPRRVAVDSRGILYASDSNNGGEIDRFDTQNVHGGGPGSLLASIPASVNEVQRVNFSGFTSLGLEFHLTCPNGVQTADIPWRGGGGFQDAIGEALRAACGENNVSVTGSFGGAGGDITVTFLGVFGSRDVPAMSCVATSGTGSCSVTTTTDGVSSALLAGGTTGLGVDPDSDGPGADQDALYVLRASSGEAVVQQFGPVNDPGLLVAPTAADAAHGAGAGFRGNVSGLGLDEASGRLFVSDTSGPFDSPPAAGAAGGGHRVYVLDDPLPDPAMALNPVTVKTDSTATFSASVDPRGGLIRCSFQYSTDIGFASTTDLAAPGCDSFNPDGGFQALSQKAAGLTPNTRYFVRLQVTRTFDTAAVATSGSRDFFTDSVPPLISDTGAIQVADTSARLVGTIDPRNSATGYHFEYGTTPDLGSSTASFNIGGGAREITVSQVVTGLAKDTDHFFRLVATNEFGTTNGATKTFHTRAVPLPPVDPGNCPNQALREEQGSTHLPDCRAYEQVSPPDKNVGEVDGNAAGGLDAGFSRDGNAAGFCTTSLFGEPPSQMTGVCAPYMARRTPTGWQTTSPVPPYCHYDPDIGGISNNPKANVSPNFERAVVEQLSEAASCEIAPLDPAAPTPSSNIYLADYGADPFDYTLLAPNPAPGTPSLLNRSASFRGGDDDFSHVVYVSDANQTDVVPTGDSPPPGNFSKLYEYAGGQLRLVSVDPAGDPFTTASEIAGSNEDIAESAVSTDGDRIYFQNGSGAAAKLYLREGATTTLHVSAPECAVPADCTDSSAKIFHGATPDGAVAFFASADKLTDASAPGGGKLYRWDRSASGGDRLTDLTIDSQPADGSSPSFANLVGISDDGETAYFVNTGQLIAGEPTGGIADPGGGQTTQKLYRWSLNGGGPALEYLGPFTDKPTGVFAADQSNTLNTGIGWSRTTPDGRYLLISSTLAYDPAADRDSHFDVYRWGADEGWTCVSCQLPGAPSAGHANSTFVNLSDRLFIDVASLEPTARISDDGKRVFFDTPDALLPQDTNGEAGCPPVLTGGGNAAVLGYPCQDVYEWNDGTLSLISSGQSNVRSYLVGATGDAGNVFFTASDRLVGHDTDSGSDLYTARVGGGFPEPPPAPPACDLEAGACEGPASAAQSIPGAGSRVFEGQGNQRQAQPRRCPRGKRRVTRNGRTRCVAKKRKRNNRAAKHNRRAAR